MSEVPTVEPPSEPTPPYQTKLNIESEPAAVRDAVSGARAAAAYQLPANPRALAKFAFGSAITIATVLVLQDVTGLLSSTSDPWHLLIRMVGLWLTVYFLFGFSVWAMFLLGGIIGGGIYFDHQGIRLWRFGKKTLWRDVKAIGMDEHPIFSAFFFQRPNAQRIILYVERPKKGKPAVLSGQVIPSFSFTQPEFNSLLGHACRHIFGFLPASAKLYAFDQCALPELRASYSKGFKKRLLFSLIIAFGFVMVFGRTAGTNYFYNEGNAHFFRQDYEGARKCYETAIQINPVFPRAWDQLARSEFRLGRVADAKKHWERALQLRPDLVEAKSALANIAVRQADFYLARALLRKCVALQPRYLPGYINLADLEIRTGNPRAAERSLRFVVTQEPNNLKAHQLFARAKLKENDLSGAGKILDNLPAAPSEAERQFGLLVRAEYETERGNFAAAAKLFADLERARQTSFEFYLERGKYYLRCGQNALAQQDFNQAQALRPNDVWPALYLAEMALLEKRDADFAERMGNIIHANVQDPAGLSYAARLLMRSQKKDQAVDVVMTALQVDPYNESAHEAVGLIMPEGKPNNEQ